MDCSAIEEIRKAHLEAGTLFLDSEFPSEEDIAFFRRKHPNVQWLRPKELCEVIGSEAEVFKHSGIENISHEDHADFPYLFNSLLMPGQSFNDGWYAGVFLFRFHRYGGVVEVVIDDRLPNLFGDILSVRKKRPYELINPLAEKALAKSYGGYAAIENYTQEHIIAELLGLSVELVPRGYDLKYLCRMLRTVLERRSWVIATSKSLSWQIDRDVDQNGLVTCFPYLVTSIRKIRNENGEDLDLVRVKPRWPMTMTYTGPWSKSSPEWNRLSPSARIEMNLSLEGPDSFWMRLKDFADICDLLEFRHQLPEFYIPGRRNWSVKVLHSEWKFGGPQSGRNFYRNPQFLVMINNCDEDHDNYATIVLELIQKNRPMAKRPYLSMAYHIFELAPLQAVPLLNHRSKEVFRSKDYSPVRCLIDRHNLTVGSYVIIPAIEEVDETGEYMLRMFTENPHELTKVKEPPTE